MIPPLKALATLECVVRHRSVSRAAEELCVTHGAVSKQLSTLAAWVGQPLFADNRRQMVPTAAALQLAHGVGMGMRAIYDALEKVGGASSEETHLRVVAPATLSMHWLIPRLPALRHSGLKIKAHIRNTHTHEDWRTLSFDLAIRTDRSVPAAYEHSLVFRDELGLVAAPHVAASAQSARGRRQLSIVESETRSGELDSWLSAAGFCRSEFAPIETFEHNYIAIEAALTGQGAVVASLPIVGNHLARGTLVQILPEVTVPGSDFSAVYDPRSASARSARAFARWLRTLALEESATEASVASKSLSLVQ